jgi:hypothetical protein
VKYVVTLRRLLTSWFVSSRALSTPAPANLLQRLTHVTLDLVIRNCREPSADAVDDLESGVALGNQALKLLRADDADHRHAGLFDEDTDLTALDIL